METGTRSQAVIDTQSLFQSQYLQSHLLSQPQELETSTDFHKLALAHKLGTEYNGLRDLPTQVAAKQGRPVKKVKLDDGRDGADAAKMKMIEGIQPQTHSEKLSTALTVRQRAQQDATHAQMPGSSAAGINGNTTTLARRAALEQVKPAWHAPWKLMRVISGHLGWVRAIAFEPDNKWFATGAGDRTIKVWDLASGTLKLTLTGHISTVRGLAVSPRHPYLFSCGEDKQVKCWDLESNKVIRHYHGHLSGVYALALHPTLDVLVSAGRDGVARVWDMRTRQNVHVLAGHKATIADVVCQAADPQVITGSMDSTVRLWDLAAGKCMTTLTHHKKSVRALTVHPTEFAFASGSADGSIKQWACPAGQLLGTSTTTTSTNTDAGYTTSGGSPASSGIINTLSCTVDNVLVAGTDTGTLSFSDWSTGHTFQQRRAQVQPGSLDSEAGVFASAFDRTGLRLVTGDADKTVKVYRQDERATEASHPVQWTPTLRRRKY